MVSQGKPKIIRFTSLQGLHTKSHTTSFFLFKRIRGRYWWQGRRCMQSTRTQAPTSGWKAPT